MEEDVKPVERLWYLYQIENYSPERPLGYEFRSRIPDLNDHPELWEEECPYVISKRAKENLRMVRMD
jgi:hypothetical protein